ncbi:MAG: PocR ligand-binding domain-containing protein [Phycisphaerae bacterium]|nr:PocR ligand-binding domain-containing protein [Phycisphaerae bacterium]
MTEKGFSIRCPHCFEWSDWPDLDPDAIAIQSDDEWEEILCDLKERPEEFSHRKMLTCQNSIGDCPAPFQAFICKNARNAHRYVESTPTWALERAFRVYGTDHVNRRDRTAIIFCTRAVPRPKYIELEKVLDRELLSRVNVGMGLEMHGPVTVYTGIVFELGKMASTYWVPVEAYTTCGPEVPPRYNPFCRICRRAGIQWLLNRFEAKASTANCVKKPVPFAKDGKCAGRIAACEANDWSHCPAFLDARRALRMCYCYDEILIKKLEENWRQRKLPDPPHQTHTCWAGFSEIAVPIVVHEHFVAVAMTGQFVLEGSDRRLLKSVEVLIERFEPLKQLKQSTRAKLISLAEVLLGCREPANDEEEYATTFRLTPGQFQEKVQLLARNAERIVTVANARYRDFRARSEAVFKQELLGRVENAEDMDGSLGSLGEGLLLNVLERMREFWAFQGVYLVNWLSQTKRLSVVAFSRKGRKPEFFGMPGKLLGIVEAGVVPAHPLPWLYDSHGRGYPQAAWMERLWSVFEEIWDDEELDVPDGRYYFVVSVPFADQIQSFIFAVRDESEVSPLRPLEKGGISPFCQDGILGTCADFVYRFAKIRHQLREKAWREFSALASHRIGNEIHAAGTLIDVLADELCAEPQWAESWGEDLGIMQRCVKSAKKMLNDLTTLTGEVRPQRRPVRVDEVIHRAIRGVLPPGGKLEMLGFNDAPEVAVDPDLMEQMFRELVTNAVRVAGENVMLTVRATEPHAGKRKGDYSEAGRCLEIWFSDNGPGIPPEQRERIFQPFTTFDRSRACLGLTIVRRIIEAHAGSISLVNAKIGTTFLIRIPVSGDMR